MRANEKGLSKMNGVSKVEANHVAYTLTIEYDQKRVTMEAIRGAMPDH